nr:four and a half LIM domains protein 2-like [Onthophagus taurus]
MSEKQEKFKGDCCGDPWPQLMMACARVVEIYSRLFDKPDLLKISKCLKSVCKTCMCKNKHKELNLLKRRDSEEIEGKDVQKLLGYGFIPDGLTTLLEAESFYSQFEEDIVPKIGTKGEKVRKEKLLKQNPLQDDSLDNCKFLDSSGKESFEEFIKTRNDFISEKGLVKYAHNSTKNCVECKKEFLQDLKHCVHEDSLLCNRHYGEKLRPRCSTCDELIFNQTCTRALGRKWHTDHFWCNECHCILTGKQYTRHDDKPYCLKCYESTFAQSCKKCEKSIGTNAKYLIYKKNHWHETCFTCKFCQKSLVNQKFITKEDDIYCERCHEEKLAPRCNSCYKTFKFGTNTVEYKNKQFHEQCFICNECQAPIGGKKFANKLDKIFCDDCYQEKFGTKCTKCNKVIIKGGVTYKNQPWHTECFNCTNCPTLLSGVTFTSRDEKPYCAKCFGKLFAKKCFGCREPINGDGIKYINYDNHHWHDNCFFCAICRCGLGGKGFIMEKDEILCPNCAKGKFKSC